MPRRKTSDMLDRSDDKSSIDDYVIFENDRGYATDSKGKIWDIGSRVSVEEAIKTGKVSENLCPDHREALQIIICRRTYPSLCIQVFLETNPLFSPFFWNSPLIK
jgi:hypothetical protein